MNITSSKNTKIKNAQAFLYYEVPCQMASYCIQGGLCLRVPLESAAMHIHKFKNILIQAVQLLEFKINSIVVIHILYICLGQ